ncbi:MAG: SUMF1/EgtB/PvdO family nonheme iron enzyme [Hyphomonadaceae bacterium]|nr:SUMF1/EgtB/PvdO family nonheme iron enzyme [Hyphomonadaceae bacterium]
MRWALRLLAAFVVLAAGMGNAQPAPKRIALVIGNAAYTTPGWALANPVRDAQLIAQRLSALGFEVDPVMNASKATMDAAMQRFGAKLRGAGADAVGVFYYAGHGLEHDGANLLVPVDVTANSVDDLRYQAPPMQFVLRDMARAGNAVNIVILDACRNTPLPSGTRAGAAGGLADLDEAPPDVLIAYATRAGFTAPDNPNERNSVFTRTLADALASNPSDTVVNLFSQVQARVFAATGRAQRPEFRSGLLRAPDWRFAAASASPVVAPPPAIAFDPRQAELAYWNSCCGSGAAAEDFEGYLAKVSAREFPGTYADTARRRAQTLRAPPVTSQPPISTPAVAVQPPRAQTGQTIKDCAECPEMVVIPAGSFVMGSAASEAGRSSDEGPQRTVQIGSFAASKFEITFAQWDACVAGGGCGGYRPADEGWGRGNQPVINVSWNDVQSYVTWINGRVGGQRYRLLSEAEWEYAARAGTSTAYSWGSDANGGCAHGNGADMAAKREDSSWTTSTCDDGVGKRTAPVGRYAPNAFGLHDMHGNVWEWVQDCWIENYNNAPGDGSARETGSCFYRVYRGGSWLNYPQFLRSALRFRSSPTIRYDDVGFRLARTL